MAATAPALVAPASSPERAGTAGEEDGAPCPDDSVQPMQGVSSTDGVDAANVACIFLPQAHGGPGAPALGATADGADAVSCAAQLDDDGLAAFLDAVKEGMRIDESRMLVFNGPDWLVNGVGLQMDEERQHFVHAMLDGLQVPDDAIAAVFVRSRLARRVAVARINDWAVPDEEMVLPFLCVSFNLEARPPARASRASTLTGASRRGPAWARRRRRRTQARRGGSTRRRARASSGRAWATSRTASSPSCLTSEPAWAGGMAWRRAPNFSDRRLALGGISLGGFSGIFLGWFHAVGHMGPGFCARRWGWVAGWRAAPCGLHRLRSTAGLGSA